MATRKLVIGHLEKVSGKLFEEYPTAIRSLIKGRSGVYALYKENSLYYIGLAGNLMGRLKTHLRDRHNGKWNRFSVYLTVHDEHMKELESLLLRIATPKGNRMSGRFMASDNLRNELNRAIKDADDERRANLLGGRAKQRRVRVKAIKGRGGAALEGAFARSQRLKGWDTSYEYSATIRRDGRIRYDGVLYDSPSAASKAALRRRSNGWAFWHYKSPKTGDWVRLNRLKR